MSRLMLTYREGASVIHRLSGAVKFLVFLLWSVLAMAGYHTPLMLCMSAVGIVFFIIARIQVRDVSFIFKMLAIFMLFNLLAIYFFAPEQGVVIYGARHLIWEGAGPYTLTKEQLFYEFNVLLKYTMIVPSAILLIVTTDPSEFASSLNKIGVPYSVAYAVSLSLRYIPDVQKDFENISHAQQARGVELSRKVSLAHRIKGASRILLPLVFSSLERIDVISRAMELRGFGKYKRRTWYSERPFTRTDALTLVIAVLLFVFGIWLTFHSGNRFYNPFQ
ncbi:MAG: energy-coupling factor transporter transmembrane protein EcfT [Treponema sp.]|jgi:energy-coupling factor transport system permease protein|nr:energy-coupling factor transporter transmembrane protein EcfT [Treponema sp.]